MKVHCAWCEKAGRDPFMGEKEPMDSDAVSHTICERCTAELAKSTAELLGSKKSSTNPLRRKRRRRS